MDTSKNYDDAIISKFKKLSEFLAYFKVEKGQENTHTTMGKNAGSFYIPNDYLGKFYELYNRELLSGKSIFLTERHPKVSPIVIDIDLRFNINDEDRKYTEHHIVEMLKLYYKYFSQYLDIKEENFKAFVFERDKPYVSSGKTKDGIHIMFPFILVEKEVQLLVREHVIKNSGSIVCDLSSLNPIQDIFDKAVITGNWMMYQSRKPNCKPYKLTYVFDHDLNILDIDEYPPDTLPQLLSIRKDYEFTPFKDGKEEAMKSELKDLDEAYLKKKSKNVQKPFKKLLLDQLDIIKKLVEVLKVERADDYSSWMELGWCLYNLDSDKLLLDWIKFSKKSSKFEKGKCEKLWNTFQFGNLGIGSLKMWAKEDNLESYNDIISKDITNYIIQNDGGTNNEIAKLLHIMYGHEFVCCTFKNNIWFKFNGTIWEDDDQGVTLRARISNEIVNEYLKIQKYYTNKAIDTDETDKAKFIEKSSSIQKLIAKLRTRKFKDDVMKEAQEVFLNKKFLESLDENRDLIGFNNGVFDLKEFKFRPGRPEDYISYCTNIDYNVFKESSKIYKEVDTFIKQLAPIQEMREYLLLLLSSYLQGHTSDEKFHIWTGSGANGKSKIVELFEYCFGDYCIKFPITLLTQKRASSNSANPEVARSKGKRFGTFQEPDENAQINVGYMKELSGGDKITARALFKEPIDFKPQFKLLLICNHLPKIPSNDGGTWRRLRVFEFKSKFVDKPDDKKPFEFKKDYNLSQKLEKWKECFMFMLIQWFKKYKETGLKEPEEVKKFTKQYEKECDVFLEFIDDKTKVNPEKHVYISALHNTFKAWYKDAYVGNKAPSRKELKGWMDQNYEAYKKTGWKGLEIVYDDEETDDDEVDNISAVL